MRARNPLLNTVSYFKLIRDPSADREIVGSRQQDNGEYEERKIQGEGRNQEKAGSFSVRICSLSLWVKTLIDRQLESNSVRFLQRSNFVEGRDSSRIYAVRLFSSSRLWSATAYLTKVLFATNQDICRSLHYPPPVDVPHSDYAPAQKVQNTSLRFSLITKAVISEQQL